jgi:hypothetical protein
MSPARIGKIILAIQLRILLFRFGLRLQLWGAEFVCIAYITLDCACA